MRVMVRHLLRCSHFGRSTDPTPSCRLPLYLTGLNLTWATALAPIISRTDTPTSSLDLARHPYLVSAAFIFAHLAAVGAIVPISIDANVWFNRAFHSSQLLRKALDAASAAFDSGDVEIVAALQTTIQELGGLVLSQSEKTKDIWRDLFIVYSSFEGLLTTVGSPFIRRSREAHEADLAL